MHVVREYQGLQIFYIKKPSPKYIVLFYVEIILQVEIIDREPLQSNFYV